MADTQYVPWWVKAPQLLQYGIVGVPALIAIGSVVALWTISNKQYDLVAEGQRQTAVAQRQTQEALDLYKGQVNFLPAALREIADKMTTSFQHMAGQHDKILQMELFTCKTSAHNPQTQEQCGQYLRDLNEHLINESSYSLLPRGNVDGTIGQLRGQDNQRSIGRNDSQGASR